VGAVSSAAERGRTVRCPEGRMSAEDKPDDDESAEPGARTALLQAGQEPARPALLSSTRSWAPQ
jgi:hypothetical protein